MFIGRKKEMAILEKHYAASDGSLVFLYGRRRVGKTELLREFVTGKPTLFYSCTETTDAEQLSSFSRMIFNAGHPAGQYTSAFSDWNAALAAINDLVTEKKRILVIDEFPYMARANPEIPSIIQNLWDHVLSRRNIMIILSGSSMSFMEKEVLSSKQPLYGRASSIIRLQPLNYVEAASFFPAWSAEDKFRAYTILGGVPHYLKQFDASAPLKENIRDNLLTNGTALYNEVEFMIRQEFREPGTYRAILGAIASGASRLNEISQKSLVKPNLLSTYLGNLMEVGLVEREFSVSAKEKESGNMQRGLYQLVDPFFRFWFTFMKPYLGELDTGDAEGICQHVIMPSLDYFASPVFEDVAIQYLRLHKWNLPFHFVKIGRWWNNNTELDILAFNEDGSKALGGECKYKNTPADLGDVRHAMSKFPSESVKEIYWCFFSRSGYTPEAKYVLGDYAFTLEDIYS